MKLIIKNLKKNFEKKEVLKNINFEFEKGKIYGLLGRNGAGKTTLFNCLNEDLEIESGEFYIEEEISRKLKTMALDLGVPVIALSQLSRGVEKREDKKPVLSDLRESGAIEQDADIVAALHAPDVEVPITDDSIPAPIQLILLKHRNGPTATIDMLFKKKTSTFLSLKRDGGPNEK